MIKFIWQILKEVKGLFLLLLTLLLSVVFQLTREPNAVAPIYPDEDPLTHPYFYFSKVELYRDTHYYFIMEHLILFFTAIYIWTIAIRFQIALFIFTAIHAVDTIDYLLAYGETWFYIESYPINWNILKCVVFVLAIINEVLLLLERRRVSSL